MGSDPTILFQQGSGIVWPWSRNTNNKFCVVFSIAIESQYLRIIQKNLKIAAAFNDKDMKWNFRGAIDMK